MKAKNKIFTKPALEKFIAKNRKAGKKIVFTNGCFDILHAGHVSVLEFSKSKGDVLVLGLNTDASVKRLKGPSRPINKQADRALVTAGLESVDAVAFFNEDTPLNLIKLVKPDVLVKGGDYKAQDIVGREYAKKVVRFPLLKGRSTTNTICKINK
ncbi:RfaE bifunctional protein [Elusimicrobium minutum Pei191]|uniref:RfaE bifunctional protein n=1 Tax=Elusimicrobium minutum (strain Pei191) TaxID=445932 RepID=B2KDY8_ELUMP|nr:adenylyltransferase/cytidyltransferase family protein [Elusimicrobium minutum]ACC98734.1 RfaE bifunctional protein [Elusimicrobium minutum Pei191]